MDPLSIIAGIAGISQAGASLSKGIYKMISHARSAPKEVSDIARGISNLSLIMGELRRVLVSGKDIYRRKLLRRVSSAMRHIGRIHDEVEDLLDVTEGVSRLKWAFRRAKATELLYQIEAHKNGINMILHTMTLAIQIKQMAKYESSRRNNDEKENRAETLLLRQQAENLAEVSYHSLRDPATHDRGSYEEPGDDDAEKSNEASASQADGQLEPWRAKTNDSATWLYELVFAPAIEAKHGLGDQQSSENSVQGQPPGQNLGTKQAESFSSAGDSNSLVLHSATSSGQLQLLVQRPIPPVSVVNELLSEWTTLTEDEIEGIDRKKTDVPSESGPRENENGEREEIAPIRFKDAVGRKFTFPFHLVKTWQGIDTLIKEAFAHVDVIGLHVKEGHYDLIGTNGEIILPSVWESVIKPDLAITMHMWPMEMSKKDHSDGGSRVLPGSGISATGSPIPGRPMHGIPPLNPPRPPPGPGIHRPIQIVDVGPPPPNGKPAGERRRKKE